MIKSVFSFLPVLLVIGAFWAIAKKKRASEKLVKRKDDIWYVLKEYLKLSGRGGARVADLSLYPRAQTIFSLREYIKNTQEYLKAERDKVFGIKEKKPIFRLPTLKTKRERISYPEKEEYHRNLELKTLETIAQESSLFREYLEIYNSLQKSEKFRELSKDKLIGESIMKLSMHRKKIVQRNRYLVCFRLYQTNKKPIKKCSNQLELTEWEAIEIELFKNPKRESGKKYKILFTASLKYNEELHWIYALQQKYLKNKVLSQKKIEVNRKDEERRLKKRALLLKTIYLPLTLYKKIGHKNTKKK